MQVTSRSAIFNPPNSLSTQPPPEAGHLDSLDGPARFSITPSPARPGGFAAHYLTMVPVRPPGEH